VLPCWTKQLAGTLAQYPDIYIGGAVGFPSGGHATAIKLAEAEQLINDGARELDIVMNVGKFLSGEHSYVMDELKQLIEFAEPLGVTTKVIIEMGALTDSQVETACELVVESGACYIKTGTGWVPGSADITRVAHIKQICADKIKIKVAGGIRTPEQFLELYALGVERMGINTATAIGIVSYFKPA